MALQYYCRPGDGKPVPLVVQSFEDPDRLPSTSKWSRTGKPSFRIPSMAVVSFWIWSSLMKEGSEDWNFSFVAFLIALLKTVVVSPLLLVLLGGSDFAIHLNTPFYGYSFLDSKLQSVPRQGRESYDAITNPRQSDEQDISSRLTSSRVDGIARASLETPENRDNIGLSPLQQAMARDPPLSLRPRFLCFVDDPDQGTYTTRKLADYIGEQGDHVDTEFVFVSYTRLQFLVATEVEIDKYQYPNEATREASRVIAKHDRNALIRYGIDSAVAAGKRAFWLDFECVRDADGVARSSSSSDDVYRICDVVRGAHSMIIAVGPPVASKVNAFLSGQDPPAYKPELITPWLRQWGSRLWTLPELLLCPSEHRIKLYAAGSNESPRALAKRNFAERAWDDGDTVKELVDHYEGSAILSPLQLMDVALGCFARRTTDQFHRGDIAYAIMGLLPDRLRPVVNNADSGFQAFARLSLSNDGQRILERLMCIMPYKKDAAWFETRDFWGARLTEINPTCYVANVVGPDTVLLAGAFGATIQWDNLDPLLCKPNESPSRKLVTKILYLVSSLVFALQKPLIIFLCLLKVSESGGGNAIVLMSPHILLALLGLGALSCFTVPLTLVWLRSLTGPSARARFLGIEGSADLATIERYFFGFNYGRLTEIRDLAAYSDVDSGGENREPAAPTDEHAFTLVDTHLMTVSRFYSKRAPVAVLICGQEGGMQRALLCSYDRDAKTFVRETVVRMSTRVLDRMERADKLRLSPNLRSDSRPKSDSEQGTEVPRESLGHVTNVGPSGAAFRPERLTPQESSLPTWRIDYALMFTMMFLFTSPLSYSTGQSYNTIYFLALLAAQIPAYVLVQRVAVQRLLPCAVFIKAISALLLNYPSAMPLAAGPVIAAIGIADGLITPLLVMLSWAWYTPHQLSLRIIIWALIGPGICHLVSLYWVNTRLFFVLGSIFGILILVAMASLNLVDIGLPRQVRWIPADEQEKLVELAAASPYATIRGASARWQRRQEHLILKCTLPTLVLAISFAGTFSTQRAWRGDSQHELFYMIILLCIGEFLHRFPARTVQVMIACSVLSVLIEALNILRLADVVLLERLPSLVIPLLWASLALNGSAWASSVKMLFISMVGVAIAMLISTMNKGLRTPVITLVMGIVEILLLVALSVYQCWESRRTATGGLEEPASEHFADDPIVAHASPLIG